MPIALTTGPANAGKARVLLHSLRAEASSARASRRAAPLLVVPTAADAQLYRRELAESGPALGVSVTLFAGLVERVVGCAAVAQPQLATPPISELARRRMLATLAGEEAMGLADGGREVIGLSGGGREATGLSRGGQEATGVSHRGQAWGRALSTTVATLELAGVRPARLAAAGADASLIAVYRAYERRLHAIGRLDVELRQRSALDALRRTPSLWTGAAVFLYGFDDLTPLELDVIETLGSVVDAHVSVSLPYEAGRVAFAGRASAFHELSPLASQHVSLRARAAYYAPDARDALHRLERSLFEQAAPEPAAGGELRLFDPDEPGLPAGAIGGPPPSATSAVAPSTSSAIAPAPTSARLDPGVAVRLLEGGSERAELQLLAAEVVALIENGLPPEEIAIVHRTPEEIAEPLRGILDEAAVPHALGGGGRFADASLGRGLLGLLACACGREDGSEGTLADLLAWLRCPGVLERVELADRLEQRALRVGVEDAAAARKMWEQQNWPLERIDRVAEAAQRGGLALVERAERELLALFSGRRARQAAVLGDDEDEQARALRVGVAALRELRELARGDEALLGGAAGLIESLRSLPLGGSSGGSGGGDGAGGGAVALLSPLALRARRVRALLLCGLQEGTFPARGEAEPLVDDRLRELLGRAGGRRSHPDEVLAAERYLLYATLSRPRERLFLSWHECGDDGEPTPRSLFVDDVCDLFDESLWTQRRRHGAGAIEPPVSRAPGDALFEALASVGVAREAAKAVAGAEPHRDGLRLRDERVLRVLRERTMWSASSLERWAACPVSWFVERMLDADDLQPEAEPLARGGLAHAVLNDVYEGLKETTGSARIDASKLFLARELAAASLRAREAEYPLSVAAERLAAARRRLHADLDRYLQSAAEAGEEQDGALQPTHFELSFGFEDDSDSLPPLQLGGDGLRLRGRIDRIDVDLQRHAIVYDYKSGRVSGERSASKWLQRSFFQMALYMRATRELLHLDPVGGLYQPLSGELKARGAMRLDAGATPPCVRTDGVEAEELDELIGEVSAAATAAATEARAGALEARATTCAYRGGCMYPSICRSGRR